MRLESIYPIPLAVPERPVFTITKKLFTPRQCESLVHFAETHGRFYRSGGRDAHRAVEIYYLRPQDLEWPFAKIGRAAAKGNVWNFALSGFGYAMRIQRYRRGGFTGQHIDFEYETGDSSKLTAMVPLVPREQWTGGRIKIGNHALSPSPDQGDCLFFPSFYPHWVTRIEKGTRIILTAWIVGPNYI
jgi:hypothetical protein